MAKKAIDDDINTFIHSIYNDITEQRTSVEHHIPNLKANIDTMRSSPGYSTSHETQPTGMLMQVKGLPRLCKNYYFDLEELESIFERDWRDERLESQPATVRLVEGHTYNFRVFAGDVQYG
jgi:hypothetical protein